MSAQHYGKDHMPDVELLHILVTWTISFKAHKTLIEEAGDSNYSVQTLERGAFQRSCWVFLFVCGGYIFIYLFGLL